jgi:hypothetical protein
VENDTRAVKRGALFGVVAGAIYGGVARLSVASRAFGATFAVMTLGFLFLVPIAMGYLTVRPVTNPSRTFRLVGPWISCIAVVFTAWLVGAEGSICIVMALPVMLAFSTIGGLIATSRIGRAPAALPMLALLPYAVMPLERGESSPIRLMSTVTSIDIDAPPSAVWPFVISVDSIRPAERRFALFSAIGFPAPVAATLDHPGLRGVRTATFEHGIVFRETIVDWETDRRLRFTIAPDSIPAATLDPHVTIGGPYFDVLSGTYDLEPLGESRTRLVLTSEHRVSTRFNLYAGWWANRIMRSIQSNILHVLRDRAERGRAR